MAQFPEELVTISKPNSDLGKQIFFFFFCKLHERRGKAPKQKQQHSLSNV